MRKAILISFLIISFFIFTGCEKECETSLFTKEGECCTYVCDTDCEGGYIEGTCQCECISSAGNDNTESEDMNIDDIFDDSSNIEPPSIPI